MKPLAAPTPVLGPDEPPLVLPEEFPRWILHEDEHLLVLNKPAGVVCHPSKRGPWSSLVGAAREYSGLPVVHLVFRLDRETSGVIVLAKDSRTASRLQAAMARHSVAKTYFALLTGELRASVTVDQPLGSDTQSRVTIKDAVSAAPDARRAVTRFEPLATGGCCTLARVFPETGRKHQIRIHAQWLGHPLVGDKLYGGDETLYLEFAMHGWTPRLAAALPLRRQALHCAEIDLRGAREDRVFHAPFPEDLQRFCLERISLAAADLTRLIPQAVRSTGGVEQ